MVGLMELNMALDHVNNNPNNSKMSFDKIKSETLTGIMLSFGLPTDI